jgi:hypothetical protein
MNTLKLFTFLTISGLILLYGCVNEMSVSGGAGGETTNGITGAVYDSTGQAAVGVKVKLRSADFLSIAGHNTKKTLRDSIDTITDSTGRFFLTSLVKGNYSIEINDGCSSSAYISCTVTSDSTDTIKLSPDTLRPYAVIIGTGDPSNYNVKVRVCGLERCVSINAYGEFIISDLPAGSFQLIIGATDSTNGQYGILNVRTFPGETVRIVYGPDHYYHAIYLNTTSAGADILEDLHDFPLCFRLNHSKQISTKIYNK